MTIIVKRHMNGQNTVRHKRQVRFLTALPVYMMKKVIYTRFNIKSMIKPQLFSIFIMPERENIYCICVIFHQTGTQYPSSLLMEIMSLRIFENGKFRFEYRYVKAAGEVIKATSPVLTFQY